MTSISTHSPLASTGVCLNILRRLLDDESAVLAQLSYVVENIHNPILENCDPTYVKLLPEVPPTMPQSTLHILNTRAANVLPSTTDGTNEAEKAERTGGSGAGEPAASSSAGTLRLLRPQPAIIRPASPARTPSGAGKAAPTNGNGGGKPAPSRKGSAGGKNAPRGATSPEVTRVLSFTEYWELFSNLPTVYAAQRAMVTKLENAVRDMTALLNRLQGSEGREEEEETVDLSLGTLADGARSGHAGVEERGDGPLTTKRTGEPSPAASGGTSAPTSAKSSGGTEGPASLKYLSPGVPPLPLPRPSSLLLRTPQPSGTARASRDNDALRVLGDIMCGFFGSAEVLRCVAEHTMYTVNYTSKSAPRVLELGRLWRRGGGGTPSTNTPQVSAAPLSPSERAVLLRYAKLLDFLLRSFGSSGVPKDSRVAISALPESLAKRVGTGGGSGAPTSTAAAVTGGGIGGVGTVRGQMALEANVSDLPDAIPNGTNGKKHHGTRADHVQLPPLPQNWKGFHTLIMLLSTPLSCLRRLVHVARCVVESHTIPREARMKLQTSFIQVADAQIVEEGVLTMEELAQHDVRTIMSLIDDSSSATIVGPDGATSGEGGASLLSQFRHPTSSRALVHYGRVYKRSGRGKHERLMFLFTDWICYVEELSSGRMRLRGAMPLDTLRVIDVADAPTLDIINCFELINAQTKRFIFFVSTPEQKRQWVDAIRFAVRQQSRFQVRAKLAATSANNNSSLAAMAAANANRSVFHNMKPTTTSAPLPHHSRLCRQRRYDHALQEYLDAQNATSVSRFPSPHLSLAASGTRETASPAHLAGTPPALQVIGDSFAELQASQSAVSASGGIVPAAGTGGGPAHHSRSSSFGQPRNMSAHRQLEYDVTPWSRQSTTHRRLRGNQDLVLSAPAAGLTRPGSSSRHSPSSSFDGSEKGTGVEDPEHRRASFGSRFDADSNDEGNHPIRASHEREKGGSGAEHLSPDDPHRSVKLMPGATSPFTPAIPHPPSRPESVGGASSSSRPPPVPGTPLRRPVSERFEVAQSSPTSSPARQQRANSVQGGAPSTVPPRPPPPSSNSFPRTRRDSSADPLQPPTAPQAATGSVDGAEQRPAKDGHSGSPATEDEIDSQLSSLVREKEEEEEAAGEGAGLPEEQNDKGETIDVGGTSFRSPSGSSAAPANESPHDEAEYPPAPRQTMPDINSDSNSDNDDASSAVDDGTGSVSLMDDYEGGAPSTLTGDPAPSEDAADLPLGAQLRTYDASPTGFDEEERVTAALTAFRPRDTSTLSSMSFSPHRLRSQTLPAPTSGNTGALGTVSEDPRSFLVGAAAPASQLVPHPPPSQYVDPSQGLEALYQDDEAQAAKEAEQQEEETQREREEAHNGTEETDDGGTGFDEAEKQQDVNDLMGTPDSSLDLSEGEVTRQEKKSLFKKKK